MKNTNFEVNSAKFAEIKHELSNFLKGGNYTEADLKKIGNTLCVLYEHLKEHNEKTNLVSDSSWEEFLYRHVLDSIYIFKYLEFGIGEKIVDIGSGAGFPGIPIKIIRQDLEVTSIESRGKKADFQREIIEKLNLKGINIINGRVEDVGRREEVRGYADKVVTRALAETAVLLEYALPLLKLGGKAVFFKGRNPEKEIERSKNALCTLGGEVEGIIEYRVKEHLPDRTYVIVRKTKETPEKYPRRTGIPSKRPILYT